MQHQPDLFQVGLEVEFVKNLRIPVDGIEFGLADRVRDDAELKPRAFAHVQMVEVLDRHALLSSPRWDVGRSRLVGLVLPFLLQVLVVQPVPVDRAVVHQALHLGGDMHA